MQKEEAGITQTYLWDGNVVGMSEREMRPESGPDDFSYRTAARYYFEDELGSPIRLLDANGDLRESYGYDEFGQDLYGNQGKTQPFGYTGYQKDQVAGTYYAQAREYRSELARFAGVDVVTGNNFIPLTQNQYNYCLNQPFRYIDPTGCLEESSDDFENKLNQVIEDNIFGITIGIADISVKITSQIEKWAIRLESRPNNIGIGTWNKWVTERLDEIARIYGSSEDDVVRGLQAQK